MVHVHVYAAVCFSHIHGMCVYVCTAVNVYTDGVHIYYDYTCMVCVHMCTSYYDSSVHAYCMYHVWYMVLGTPLHT